MPSTAEAQENLIDLTISPPTFDFTTTPGGTIREKLRVRNNTSAPVELAVEVQRLEPSETITEFILSAPGPSDDFVGWVAFDQSRFTAPPQEWTDIPFTIVLPETAAFGYYFALVVGSPPAAPKADKLTVQITGGVAAPALLRVESAGARAEGRIVEFSTTRRVFEWLPAEFVVRVKSTGNIHIKPRGNIFISNRQQADLGLLEVNPELGAVLPDGTRTFTAAWADGFIVREPVLANGEAVFDEAGKPVKKLTIHWDKLTRFRLGGYSANLVLVYAGGDRDETLESATTFWVIPYTMLGVLAVGALTVLILGYVLLRLYVRRQIRRERRRVR